MIASRFLKWRNSITPKHTQIPCIDFPYHDCGSINIDFGTSQNEPNPKQMDNTDINYCETITLIVASRVNRKPAIKIAFGCVTWNLLLFFFFFSLSAPALYCGTTFTRTQRHTLHPHTSITYWIDWRQQQKISSSRWIIKWNRNNEKTVDCECLAVIFMRQCHIEFQTNYIDIP